MPAVVLVGRPNVGKSTLFNKITGHRRAIVAPVAGTTRDSLARPAVWQGRSFQLFDTGGLYGASEDPLHELVVEHGKRAIVGADLLVMVVDGRDGLVSGDETIARELREADRPLILAINKIDDKRARHATMDFYRLGIEPVVEISAEHGTGVGDLLDEIVKALGTRDLGFGIRDLRFGIRKLRRDSWFRRRRRARRCADARAARSCAPRARSAAAARATTAAA